MTPPAIDLEPAPPVVLSTRDVAHLLGVGEATVKRWANGGRLACRKTPGGHRKFSLSEVSEFRARYAGWRDTPVESGERLQESLLKLALTGDGAGLTRLALASIDAGLSIEELCEEWLLPMLAEVRRQTQNGQLPSLREQVVSSAVSDMISQIGPYLQCEPAEGVAMTGSLQGDESELEARIAGLVLRRLHATVVHIGSNASVEELIREADREHVRWIVLGAGGPIDSTQRGGLEKLGSWAAPKGVQVFLRGVTANGAPLPPGVESLPTLRGLAESQRRTAAATPPRP